MMQGIETTGSFVCEGTKIDLPPDRMRKLLDQAVSIYTAAWIKSDEDADLLLKHMLQMTRNAPVISTLAEFKARAPK